MRIIPILPNQEPAILLDISPFHHQFLGGIPNQRELVAKKVPWFHQKQMAQAPSPPWNSSINGCLLLLVRGTRSMVQKHLCILYMYISYIGLYMSCQLIIYVTTLKPYNRLKKKKRIQDQNPAPPTCQDKPNNQVWTNSSVHTALWSANSQLHCHKKLAHRRWSYQGNHMTSKTPSVNPTTFNP